MKSVHMAKRHLAHGAAFLALIATSSISFAQGQDNAARSRPAQDDTDQTDIIVTGTLLRGIAPTGTNVVTVSDTQIRESGATSSNQILSRIPQVSSAFNKVATLPSLDPGNSVVRPNLRNLGAAGGSTTLILVDGHRQVNAGILVTTPDPDVIPPAVLERVDIVPDGGSSIYGSDAVGGVINFITKKRFDGVQADARYGLAENYRSFDASLTVGRAWDTGSAYISGSYVKNDAIFGRDRGYVQQRSPNNGSCAPGTVFITSSGTTTSYALPARVAGTLSQCDNTDNLSIIPAQERISLFSVFTQELGSGIDLDIRGFYTRRTTDLYRDFNSGDFAQAVTITSANPFYIPIGASDPGTQTVRLSYVGLAPSNIRNALDEFGVTPTVTADLGSGWQARILGNFQRSTVTTLTPQIDAAAQERALAGTTTSAALNPYNPGATNASVLNGILAQENAHARQDLINARAVIDGTLAELPGGSVHVALGAEFIRETLKVDIRGTFRGGSDVARNVKSLFGEIAIPLVGAQNAFAGVQSLTLSASGRYDHYSDFGGTFNPKIGATYKPINDLTIRANWGKSFNAPSLADKDGAPDTRAIIIGNSPWTDPNDPTSSSSRSTVLIAGGNASLQPQKADTWSVGLDFAPSFAKGLKVSATYYNISMKNQIGIIPIFTGNTFVPAYSAYYFKNPSLSQLTSTVGSLPLVGGTSLASLYTGGNSPYVLLDARRQNLGLLKQSGIDFNATYNAPTDFGAINLMAGGTYTLRRKISGAVGQPFSDDLLTPGGSRFSLLTSVGATVGDLNGSLTWTHSAGYAISPAIGTQTKVGAFDTVDLFLSYAFKAETGALKNLALTFNVTNLLDQDPPFYNLDPGYTNGSTLGRFLQFGISKRF